MDKHTAPETPASKGGPTQRVVHFSDFLGTFAEHAARLRRRRVLTRTGKPVDAETLRRAPEITPRRGEDVRRALYLATEGGLVMTPAPTLPLPDRKLAFARWLLARLAESSTYRGAFLLLGALGWIVTPEHAEAFIAAGIAMAGAIGVLSPDRPKEE